MSAINCDDEKLLIKPQQAFKMASVGRELGYKLITTGEWPSIRIGRVIRIPLAGLQAWIEKKLAEPK